MCSVLQIAPSTYYARHSRPASAWSVRDAELVPVIRQIHGENYGVYGARKVHAKLRQLAGRGAQISITAVVAELGIPRSRLYRNAEARELIADRIAKERVNTASNQAEEVHRLGLLIDALAGRSATRKNA